MIIFKKIRYAVVFNRSKELNQYGEALIQIRAYQYYKKPKNKYFSTNIYLKPEFWDKRNTKVKHTHPNHFMYNKLIRDQLEKIEAYEIKMINQMSTGFPIERLNEYKEEKNIPSDFITFCFQKLEEQRLELSTKKTQTSSLGKLKNFRKVIHFHEMDFNLITSFDNFLQKFDYHINYIHKIHRIVKAYVNHAVKAGLIEEKNNPYKLFKLKSVEPERIFLTIEELSLIENLVIPESEKKLNKIRELFLICSYIGFRISDLTKLTRSDFVKTERGYYLSIKITKTKKALTLPLFLLWVDEEKGKGKAEILIEKYFERLDQLKIGKRADIYPIFRVSSQYFNRSIKRLAQLAGVKKNITSRVCRRTFATQLCRKVNLPTVQKMLGHSSIDMTLVYVELSNRDVENDLKNAKW